MTVQGYEPSQVGLCDVEETAQYEEAADRMAPQPSLLAKTSGGLNFLTNEETIKELERAHMH